MKNVFYFILKALFYGGLEGPIEIKVLLSKINFCYLNQSFVTENELFKFKLKFY